MWKSKLPVFGHFLTVLKFCQITSIACTILIPRSFGLQSLRLVWYVNHSSFLMSSLLVRAQPRQETCRVDICCIWIFARFFLENSNNKIKTNTFNLLKNDTIFCLCYWIRPGTFREKKRAKIQKLQDRFLPWLCSNKASQQLGKMQWFKKRHFFSPFGTKRWFIVSISGFLCMLWDLWECHSLIISHALHYLHTVPKRP